MLRANFEVNPLKNVGWHLYMLEKNKYTKVKTDAELEVLEKVLKALNLSYEIVEIKGFHSWRINLV